MAPTRRKFLTVGGLAAAAALLSSCAPSLSPLLDRGADLAGLVDDSQPPPELAPAGSYAWRVLSRTTFGPRPAERARAAQIGVADWIEEQLAPESIADARCDVRLLPLETLHLDRSTLFDVHADAARGELQQAALLRAIHSRRQLYEVMVDFWSDHFSISTLKGTCAWLKTLDDREVIRPHAMGCFADLLRASMRSPAMLTFLDNVDNRAGRPNENYARELLELHTLGVDAGYSQHDVGEVARCLTGWCVDSGLWLGTYRFRADLHDDQPKQLLDIKIPAGAGAVDGDMVCEAILHHPALSRFLARKLARRFVADEPAPALVERAAAAFRASNGEIKPMLHTILVSPELASAPPKLKRPLDFVAGALRQLDARGGEQHTLDALARMGQPLFQWPSPDGFPDHAAAWSGNLLPRWQFALALAGGATGGPALDMQSLPAWRSAADMATLLDRLAMLLLNAPLPGTARDALGRELGPIVDEDSARAAVAVLLASPQYQWK